MQKTRKGPEAWRSSRMKGTWVHEYLNGTEPPAYLEHPSHAVK